MVNTDRYSPHKQRLSEVLNYFDEYYKQAPKAKGFNNDDLNLPYLLKSKWKTPSLTCSLTCTTREDLLPWIL